MILVENVSISVGSFVPLQFSRRPTASDNLDKLLPYSLILISMNSTPHGSYACKYAFFVIKGWNAHPEFEWSHVLLGPTPQLHGQVSVTLGHMSSHPDGIGSGRTAQ